MSDDRVADLVSLWQRRQADGDNVTLEDLCRESPELLPELRKRIEAIRMVEAFADTVPVARQPAPTVPDGIAKETIRTYHGFTIVRRIGEGGMGLVFEARDTRLKRSVAIKEMKPEFAGNPIAKVMFLREARAAATVRHDHIVPIYHVGEQDGIPFLVMPLLQGESLATRLDRGPLSPNEAIRIGREIAQGLAAAHEAGLIHRDIKPANIWLESPRDRVLILDFGLARISDSEETITRPGTILGTPAYLSPEQAAGMPMDHRADLFSLGVTLYHATTGQRPFQGETLTKTLRAVTSHHPPPPRTLNSEVPSWLSDSIMKLMAKQPGDRPASAAGVFDEPAPSTLPTPAVVSAAPAEQQGAASDKRTWAFLGIAAIVGVAVVVWLATR